MAVSIIQFPGTKPEQVRTKKVTYDDGRQVITRYRAIVRGYDVGGDTERAAYTAAVEHLRTDVLRAA